MTGLINVVFRNEFFIIVDKPSCVLSVPSRLGKNETRLCLGTSLQNELGRQIYPCHRLDYEVSGLLLFALDKLAHKIASRWFEEGEIQKKYSAWCTGVAPAFSSELWHSFLLRGKKRAYEGPHGKESITKVKYLGLSEHSYLCFELEPVTGRSHQLRYELFKHGFPIVGDELYGSSEKFDDKIALRSFEIDFSNCSEREQFNLPRQIELEKIYEVKR